MTIGPVGGTGAPEQLSAPDRNEASEPSGASTMVVPPVDQGLSTPADQALGDDTDDQWPESPGSHLSDSDTPDDARDWAWVEEWRNGGEPVPWGPGIALAGFTAFLVASAVYVLSAGLADRPVVAIGVNVLVTVGLGPALWLSRGLPVLRWIAAGAVVGVLAAWLSVLIFLA